MNLKRIFRNNLLSNIFLLISIILIVASFFFRNINTFQFQIIFLTVVLYLITSILHHYFDKSLTFEVGLEYILIGALAFLVVFGIAL